MNEIVIKTNGLTKDYGEGRGIFGIDLEIKKGEVFGYVGTNGSGKTTTIRSNGIPNHFGMLNHIIEQVGDLTEQAGVLNLDQGAAFPVFTIPSFGAFDSAVMATGHFAATLGTQHRDMELEDVCLPVDSFLVVLLAFTILHLRMRFRIDKCRIAVAAQVPGVLNDPHDSGFVPGDETGHILDLLCIEFVSNFEKGVTVQVCLEYLLQCFTLGRVYCYDAVFVAVTEWESSIFHADPIH